MFMLKDRFYSSNNSWDLNIVFRLFFCWKNCIGMWLVFSKCCISRYFFFKCVIWFMRIYLIYKYIRYYSSWIFVNNCYLIVIG